MLYLPFIVMPLALISGCLSLKTQQVCGVEVDRRDALRYAVLELALVAEHVRDLKRILEKHGRVRLLLSTCF